MRFIFALALSGTLLSTGPSRANDFDDFFNAGLKNLHKPILFGQCGNKKVVEFMFFPVGSSQGTTGEFAVSNPVDPGRTLLNIGDVALKPYVDLSNALQGGVYELGMISLDLEYIRHSGLRILQPKDFKDIMVKMPTYECPNWEKQYGYSGEQDVQRIYDKLGWGKSAYQAFAEPVR